MLCVTQWYVIIRPKIFSTCLSFSKRMQKFRNFFVGHEAVFRNVAEFHFLPKCGEPLNFPPKDGGNVELSPFIPRYGRTVHGKPSTFHRVDYGKDGASVKRPLFIPSIRTYGAGTRLRKPRYVRTGNRVLFTSSAVLRRDIRMLLSWGVQHRRHVWEWRRTQLVLFLDQCEMMHRPWML
jgi:hypothetical protein